MEKDIFYRVDKRMGKYKTYLHKPPHLFIDKAYYIITSHCVENIRPFYNNEYKKTVCETLFCAFEELHNWDIVAYVVLDNHYHILVKAGKSEELPDIIASAHKFSSRKINKIEDKVGRQIWYEYWDTVITSLSSFYARFNYIHYNPVKHGYVKRMEDYLFSSYRKYAEIDKRKLDQIQKKYPFDKLKIREI